MRTSKNQGQARPQPAALARIVTTHYRYNRPEEGGSAARCACGRAPGSPLTRAPLLIAIGRVRARWERQTMKWMFGASLVTVTVLIVTTTVSIQASADSCTERQQVCFAYCQKAESNTPQCPAACMQGLSY